MRLLAALVALILSAPAFAQTYVAGQRGQLVDGSGTVTTGAASKQVFAYDGARQFLFCLNPIAETEPLYVNIGQTATATGSSIELAPGGSVTFANNFIPVQNVNVTAATTGHRYVCKAGSSQ